MCISVSVAYLMQSAMLSTLMFLHGASDLRLASVMQGQLAK